MTEAPASVSDMPAVISKSRQWQHNLAIIIGLILVSGGFARFVFEKSMLHGRLSGMPMYDDVVYFVDGMNRLSIYERDGWSGVSRDFVANPPHSPYSTSLAFICFLVFGKHDWAPYIGNTLIVVGTLGYVIALNRRVPGWGAALGVGVMLGVPILGLSMHEFRPDLACALVTAILLCEITFTNSNNRTWQRSILLGGLLGLALVIKPSVCPVTFLLTGGTFFINFCADLIDPTRKISWQRTLLFPVSVILFGLLFYTPYLIIAHEHIFDYIYTNVFGTNRKFNVTQGTWWEHFIYYFNGYAGKWGLGEARWLLAAWSMLGLLFVGGGILSGRRSTLIRLGCVVAACFMLPTLNAVKQPYFGSVFYYTLTFMGIVSMGMLIERFNSHQWLKGGLIALALSMIIYDGSKVDVGHTWFGDNNDAGSVQRAICKAVDSVATDRCHVFLTTTGCISTPMMSFDLLRAGHRDVSVYEWSYEPNLDVDRVITESDIVIASEPGSGMVTTIFPSAKKQSSTLDFTRDSGRFTEIAAIPTKSGAKFFVFVKNAYLASLGDRKVTIR